MTTAMTPSRPVQLAILGGLALLMLATRYQAFLQHFVEVPDASWAIFFIAGFYLAGLTLWAFPLLMIESVLIDWFATQHLGVSSFCLTPAYAALIPTHAVLWFGGWWLRARQPSDLRGLMWLAGSAFISVSLAYAISNGSFYWFGGRYPNPNFAQYLERFFAYYQHFLVVPCTYIAAAALVHVGIVWNLRQSANAQRRQP